jgi:hypothetical protein
LELINLIFRLGVLFAIYGFLWFFIELGLKLLIGGRKRTLGEIYLIKTVKYLFLVNVTFLFCLEQLDEPGFQVNYLSLAPSFIILMVYFLGKLQQKEQRIQLMTNFTQGLNDVPFHRNWEIGLLVVSAMAFVGFVFFPQYSENGISRWFQRSILDIENTVLIGFIFKVIGFFFLTGLFVKMLNALNFIISGKPMVNVRTSMGTKKNPSDDSFDDFEEIDDNKLSE